MLRLRFEIQNGWCLPVAQTFAFGQDLPELSTPREGTQVRYLATGSKRRTSSFDTDGITFILDSGAGADCIISISNVHDLFEDLGATDCTISTESGGEKRTRYVRTLPSQVEVQAATPR